MEFIFFFFNDTATTEIYTLSLHDALPIYLIFDEYMRSGIVREGTKTNMGAVVAAIDRKSTRLNSSHGYISYAVFCLKKKKNIHSKKDNLFKPSRMCDGKTRIASRCCVTR